MISFNGRKWRETKEPLDEGEGEKWKIWFKTKYKKTKIMASGPITAWQIDGEEVEDMTDFLFLGSKITVDGGCIQEIRKRLLGRKVMANLDKCVENQRH